MEETVYRTGNIISGLKFEHPLYLPKVKGVRMCTKWDAKIPCQNWMVYRDTILMGREEGSSNRSKAAQIKYKTKIQFIFLNFDKLAIKNVDIQSSLLHRPKLQISIIGHKNSNWTQTKCSLRW